VLFNWAYSYFTYKRGMRIITGLSEQPAPEKDTPDAALQNASDSRERPLGNDECRVTND
jgi:hypothetical protein